MSRWGNGKKPKVEPRVEGVFLAPHVFDPEPAQRLDYALGDLLVFFGGVVIGYKNRRAVQSWPDDRQVMPDVELACWPYSADATLAKLTSCSSSFSSCFWQPLGELNPRLMTENHLSYH